MFNVHNLWWTNTPWPPFPHWERSYCRVILLGCLTTPFILSSPFLTYTVQLGAIRVHSTLSDLLELRATHSRTHIHRMHCLPSVVINTISPHVPWTLLAGKQNICKKNPLCCVSKQYVSCVFAVHPSLLVDYSTLLALCINRARAFLAVYELALTTAAVGWYVYLMIQRRRGARALFNGRGGGHREGGQGRGNSRSQGR
jgi:hypothetical protein